MDYTVNHQRNANHTTMRYHFIPVRMAFIKADRKRQRCQGCGEIGARREEIEKEQLPWKELEI